MQNHAMPELNGPRAMMATELQKLSAPLVMLNNLSRCLTNEPEDLEIRESITALSWRAKWLGVKLGSEDDPSVADVPGRTGDTELLSAEVRGSS